MRGRIGRVQIESRDTTDGHASSYIITLTAPENGFPVTDLSKHGPVTRPLDPDLKQAAKDSIETCQRAAESMLSPPIPKSTRMLKHRTGEIENSNVARIIVRRLK